jgi:hypothetical protein
MLQVPSSRSMLVLAAVSASAVACRPPSREPKVVYPTALSTHEPPIEVQGEIGAGPAVATDGKGILGGGDVRGGYYWPRWHAIPMLVGNRLGFEARVRALYGTDASGLSGNLLVGATPSFTHQFGGVGRNATGWRLSSALGLIAPETGFWIRAGAPTRFYLGWRAPVVWLPESQVGLELSPSLVWDPVGRRFLGTLSVGGFLR